MSTVPVMVHGFMCSEGSDNSLYLFQLALYTWSTANFNKKLFGFFNTVE